MGEILQFLKCWSDLFIIVTFFCLSASKQQIDRDSS